MRVELGTELSELSQDEDAFRITGTDVVVVALETAHVLLEYPTVENRWGGPERRWVPRARVEDDHYYVLRGRQDAPEAP